MVPSCKSSFLRECRTAPICVALKLHEFLNFASDQPRLKRRQMLPFYAFVGKLHSLSTTVATGIHRISERAVSGDGGNGVRLGLYVSPRHRPRSESDEGDS